MPPDTNSTQQNYQTPPAFSSKSRSKSAKLLIFILVLAIGAPLVGTFVLMNSLNSKDKELTSLKKDLDSTKQELTAAKAKLEELDNPAKKARDGTRKNDLSKLMAKLNEYADKNNGQFPSTEPTFFKNEFGTYIAQLTDFTDPNTKKAYTITPVAKVQTPPGLTLGDIQYQWPGKCSGSEFDDDATERQAAARLVLESGDTYCLDS